MAAWGTDNGTYGSYTTKVTYGNKTWTKKIDHGNNCDRSTCGGLNRLVIDNRERLYTSITVSGSSSGANIGGGTHVMGFKIGE